MILFQQCMILLNSYPYGCLCILKFQYPIMHATLLAARPFIYCWDAYLWIWTSLYLLSIWCTPHYCNLLPHLVNLMTLCPTFWSMHIFVRYVSLVIVVGHFHLRISSNVVQWCIILLHVRCLSIPFVIWLVYITSWRCCIPIGILNQVITNHNFPVLELYVL